MKTCVICKSEFGKYKCPTCLIYYCSVVCCKKHREDKCEVSRQEAPVVEKVEQMFTTPSTISVEKLKVLADDKDLKDLLGNPHLRDLLQVIDSSKKPDEIMQKAMQEPLFVEFADACLKIVEPPE